MNTVPMILLIVSITVLFISFTTQPPDRAVFIGKIVVVCIAAALIIVMIWSHFKTKKYKEVSEIGEKKASDLVLEGLKKKYGEEFELSSVTDNREFSNSKNQYTVYVYSKKLNDTFPVNISVNGNRAEERYAVYMYKPQLDEELDSVAEKTAWYTERFDSYYDDVGLDEKKQTFMEYKADSVTLWITVNVTPVADDPGLGESLYQYLMDLHEMGYERIDFRMQEDRIGEVILFKWDDRHPYMLDFKDKKNFLKRVDSALNSTCTCGCGCGTQ